MIHKERISNMLSNPRLYDDICGAFEKSIGTYRYRIRQNFYPIFWITAPVYILNLINIRPNKGIGALINLLFWISSAIGAYLLEKFLDTTSIGQDFVATVNSLLK